MLCLKAYAGGCQAAAAVIHLGLQLLHALLQLLVQLDTQCLRLPPADVYALAAEGAAQQSLIVKQLGAPGGRVCPEGQDCCIHLGLLLLHCLLLGLEVRIHPAPLSHKLHAACGFDLQCRRAAGRHLVSTSKQLAVASLLQRQ